MDRVPVAGRTQLRKRTLQANDLLDPLRPPRRRRRPTRDGGRLQVRQRVVRVDLQWLDADPSEDGLQPAPPAPTAKRVVTGHVLNGLERTQEEVAGSLGALREKGRATLTEMPS